MYEIQFAPPNYRRAETFTSVKMMDHSSTRMIDNDGPVIHDAVFVVTSLRHSCSKRIGKGMKLDRLWHDRSCMRMKMRISEGIVVLMARMFLKHLSVF